MGYPFLYSSINLLPYYHNFPCIKFPNDFAFVTQFPVSDLPVIYQYVENLFLYKHKWECGLKWSKDFCLYEVSSVELSGDR